MIYNALIFSEAIDQVERILTSTDMDEVCDRIEKIVPNEDLSLAVMMLFLMKLKGVDTSALTGVELANTPPSIQDLILPPGVKR